jgi:hypothetical protein
MKIIEVHNCLHCPLTTMKVGAGLFCLMLTDLCVSGYDHNVHSRCPLKGGER